MGNLSSDGTFMSHRAYAMMNRAHYDYVCLFNSSKNVNNLEWIFFNAYSYIAFRFFSKAMVARVHNIQGNTLHLVRILINFPSKNFRRAAKSSDQKPPDSIIFSKISGGGKPHTPLDCARVADFVYIYR